MYTSLLGYIRSWGGRVAGGERRRQGDKVTGGQGDGVTGVGYSVVRVLRCGLRLDPAAHAGDGEAEVAFCFMGKPVHPTQRVYAFDMILSITCNRAPVPSALLAEAREGERPSGGELSNCLISSPFAMTRWSAS